MKTIRAFKDNNFSYLSLSKCYNIKNLFYLKSLQLKTDWSYFKTYHRLSHPKYWDVDRLRTKYLRENKDHKNVKLRTQDPLFYEDSEGFKRLGLGLEKDLDSLIENELLSKFSKTEVSPYKCINLIYNICKKDMHLYYTLIPKLDAYISTQFLEDDIDTRYIYGYLYSHFKTGLLSQVNLSWFLDIFTNDMLSFHASELIDLIEVSVSKDSLNFTTKFDYDIQDIVSNMILACCYNYDNTFKNNTDLFIRFFEVQLNNNLIAFPKVWELIEKDLKENLKRKYNINDLDVLIKFLNMHYSNSNSLGYKSNKVNEIINLIKNKIKEDENFSYFYDIENSRRLDLNELALKRNDINEKTHYLKFNEQKEILDVLSSSTELDIPTKEEVFKIFDEDKEEKIHHFESVGLLNELYPEFTDLIKEFSDEYLANAKNNLIQQLKKEGKFDSLFEKKAPALPTASPTAGKGGAKDSKDEAADSHKAKKEKKKK